MIYKYHFNQLKEGTEYLLVVVQANKILEGLQIYIGKED